MTEAPIPESGQPEEDAQRARGDGLADTLRLAAAAAGETLDTLATGDVEPPRGPPRSATGSLTPGSVLAGRFAVQRLIGAGGMGEVYEAHDLELNARVALKTIRPDSAADGRAFERFKREIHLARQVTHPNVCRTFDLFLHAGGDERGVAGRSLHFVTMELLAGGTLHERIQRQGRLDETEALAILRQLAAALATAHRSGVIHRDFKSSNVVLVGSSSGGGERAVVTDFGLARLAKTGDESSRSLTASREVVGTPGYMAPEQVRGGELTPAVDIYALGVVAYEMVTGRMPFTADTPLALALKCLEESPPPPRELEPGISGAWDAAILRCLEREPSRRFRDVEDFVRALSGDANSRRPPPSRRRWAAFAVVAALVTAAILAAVALRNHNRPALHPARPAIAILGFKNLSASPEAAWLAGALEEMLATELAAGEKLRVVAAERVAQLRIDLGLAGTDPLREEQLSHAARNLGADLLVTGSYVILGGLADGRIRLDLRLSQAQSGEGLLAAAESGSVAQLFDLVLRVGSRLREHLGAGGHEEGEARTVLASLPADGDAARLYLEGLARLRSFDAGLARDLLVSAAAIEPDHPLVHFALSTAWGELGYVAKRDEAARKAFDLFASLPREEKLLVEGWHRECALEWDKAIAIYNELRSRFPDDIDHGLRLSRVLRLAGKGQQAVAVVRSLLTSADDPRLDLEEARGLQSISDLPGSRDAASRAAARGERRGAKLLVAHSRVEEGWALYRLGQTALALAAFQAGADIFSDKGDRSGLSRALNCVALVLVDQGDRGGAVLRYEESLALAREIGQQGGIARATNNLAILHYEEGDLPAAQRMMEEALSAFREIDDKEAIAQLLTNIGVLQMFAGRLERAAALQMESLEAARAAGNRSEVVGAETNLALLRVKQGRLGDAREALSRALRLESEVGTRRLRAELHEVEAMIAIEEGKIADARRSVEAALALWRETGETSAELRVRLSAARILLEEQRPADAAAAAEKVSIEHGRRRTRLGEAEAALVLAQSRLLEGKTAEAETALARAAALLQRSGHEELAIALERVRGAICARTERIPAARQAFASASERARQAGFLVLELEARVDLGSLEAAAGGGEAGRETLEAARREARAAGLARIASR